MSAPVFLYPTLELAIMSKRPTTSTIKVNVDVSIKEGYSDGFVMVARNCSNEIMAAETTYPTQVLSPSLEEALGLWWAMLLASAHGFRNVYFEIDCLQLFGGGRIVL